MDFRDWNDLVTERTAIMQFDAGMEDKEARLRAWKDTEAAFGVCPLLRGKA